MIEDEDFGKSIREADHRHMKSQQHVPLSMVGRCTSCGKKFTVSSFRDKLGLTEFVISGLCQECQDKAL